MPKYHGKIGFSITEEIRPGIYDQRITERQYKGDILQNQRRWEAGELMNDDVNVSNRISIVADEYAYANFGNIRYAQFMNSMWKVTSIEVNRPRIVLSLGGVYNGPFPG